MLVQDPTGTASLMFSGESLRSRLLRLAETQDSSSLTIRSPILADDVDSEVRFCSIFVTKYCEKNHKLIKFHSFDHSALELPRQESIADIE